MDQMWEVALPPTKSLPHESLEWDFPITGCTLFWGPYNKDPTIKGTTFGSPIFGNPSNVKYKSDTRLSCGLDT